MLFEKTVDGALATFNKALADLKQVVEAQKSKVSDIDASISEKQKQRVVALNEHDRAKKVISQIETLVSL